MGQFDHPAQQLYTFVQLALPIGFKVLMAIVCGGFIGLERELKGKPAGVKTNILICLGATLYTIISVLMAESFSDTGFRGDPGRIAAQVVVGIGFIGAGAIMQSRATVAGLTTAATMWVVSAIGMCIGGGYPVVGFVFTMTVLFTLLAIDRLETRFINRSGARAVEIIFEDDDLGTVRSEINKVMAADEIGLDDFDIAKNGNQYVLHLQYTNRAASHKRFILDLWRIKGIREVRQL
ncbi:MAG: MgtC/SapB family protein [Bdellovibrionota bacterium]